MSTTRCYNYKKYGHIAPNYPKNFCNYCKQQGHIIKDCTIRSTHSNKAYHVVVTSALQPIMSAGTATNDVVGSQPITPFIT